MKLLVSINHEFGLLEIAFLSPVTAEDPWVLGFTVYSVPLDQVGEGGDWQSVLIQSHP